MTGAVGSEDGAGRRAGDRLRRRRCPSMTMAPCKSSNAPSTGMAASSRSRNSDLRRGPGIGVNRSGGFGEGPEEGGPTHSRGLPRRR